MMAEFAEVMRQAWRMCKAYPDCIDCPMTAWDCDIRPDTYNAEYGNTFERTVMAWAAKHPEPVYPTWRDWLEIQYYQTRKAVDCVHESFLSWLNNTRIPADIAEKLGIEPKEV